MIDQFPILKFRYVNHRGEEAIRRIIAPTIYYGNSDFYPNDQWMLRGYDIGKRAWRDFALGHVIPEVNDD